jgi:hypothetical protein
MTFGLASSEFRQKNNKLEKNCKLEKNWTQKWLIYWSEKVEKVEKKVGLLSKLVGNVALCRNLSSGTNDNNADLFNW